MANNTERYDRFGHRKSHFFKTNCCTPLAQVTFDSFLTRENFSKKNIFRFRRLKSWKLQNVFYYRYRFPNSNSSLKNWIDRFGLRKKFSLFCSKRQNKLVQLRKISISNLFFSSTLGLHSHMSVLIDSVWAVGGGRIGCFWSLHQAMHSNDSPKRAIIIQTQIFTAFGSNF